VPNIHTLVQDIYTTISKNINDNPEYQAAVSQIMAKYVFSIDFSIFIVSLASLNY
jgi:hypothetical protein